MSSDAGVLNFYGMALKASIASFTVSAFIHPIGTAKNILMANRMPLEAWYKKTRNIRAYYAGYLPCSISESTQLVAGYYINEQLKKCGLNEHTCAIAPLIAVSPIAALGEGIMINKQTNRTHRISLLDAMQRALTPSSLTATFARDIPYVYAVFGAAPIIQRRFKNSEQASMQALAGMISGFAAGVLTAPLDHIKTIVQADGVSYRCGMQTFGKRLFSKTGRKSIYRSAGYQGVYLSFAIGILNMLNHQIPRMLPNSCFE